MEIPLSDQLSALAHPNRLDLFRLLMRRYPDAVPAGEIARALELKPNTASVYLATLKRAGLISQTRTGTSLQYAANLDNIRGLFGNLLSDCCQNRPDLCLPSFPDQNPDYSQKKPCNVLFVCTGNSARSLMAEAILRHKGTDQFDAFSAGLNPAPTPNPMILSLLKQQNYDISGLTTKSLDVFQTPGFPKMDIVITLCDHAANEECPALPGAHLNTHWGLPDPAQVSGDDTKKMHVINGVYQVLLTRITDLSTLRPASLSRISLQHHLDRIGQIYGC